MSLALLIVTFGAMMIYAGWKNRSLVALIQGDSTVTKPATTFGVVK